MSTCDRQSVTGRLRLPGEFEDLTGLLEADIRAMVLALTSRAGERLLLTRRESRYLRDTLLDRLTGALNDSLEPLSADRR